MARLRSALQPTPAEVDAGERYRSYRWEFLVVHDAPPPIHVGPDPANDQYRAVRAEQDRLDATGLAVEDRLEALERYLDEYDDLHPEERRG